MVLVILKNLFISLVVFFSDGLWTLMLFLGVLTIYFYPMVSLLGFRRYYRDSPDAFMRLELFSGMAARRILIDDLLLMTINLEVA